METINDVREWIESLEEGTAAGDPAREDVGAAFQIVFERPIGPTDWPDAFSEICAAVL